MAYRDLTANTANNEEIYSVLLDKTEHSFCHLVKFELPNQGAGERQPSFTHLTDGAFDIVFDDNQVNKYGNSFGPQTYVANTIKSISDISESSEARAGSCTLKLNSGTLGTQETASLSFYEGTVTSTKSFIDMGFKKGDRILITSSTPAQNSNQTFILDDLLSETKAIVSFTQGTLLTDVETFVEYTLTLSNKEVSIFLDSTDAASFTSYINKNVDIYRALFDPSTGDLIGSPFLIFKGIIAGGKLKEDPYQASSMTWTLTSHWGDFVQVRGRRGLDSSRRLVEVERLKNSTPIKSVEYSTDLGFMHAEAAYNINAPYMTTEQRTRIKKKKKWSGKKVSIKTYYVDVEKTQKIEFNLTSEYLPVIYGVQRTAVNTIFCDLLEGTVSDPDYRPVLVKAATISEGPISGILNIIDGDTSQLCLDYADFADRAAGGTGTGRLDQGDILISPTAFYDTTVYPGVAVVTTTASNNTSYLTVGSTTNINVGATLYGVGVEEGTEVHEIISNTLTLTSRISYVSGQTFFVRNYSSITPWAINAPDSYTVSGTNFLGLDKINAVTTPSTPQAGAYFGHLRSTKLFNTEVEKALVLHTGLEKQVANNAPAAIAAAYIPSETFDITVASSNTISNFVTGREYLVVSTFSKGMVFKVILRNPGGASNKVRVKAVTVSAYWQDKITKYLRVTPTPFSAIAAIDAQAISVLEYQKFWYFDYDYSFPVDLQSSTEVAGTASAGFTIQDMYFKGDPAEYWGPRHTLRDTAYILNVFQAPAQTGSLENLEDPELVVKGKFIDCHNYDNSFTVIGNANQLVGFTAGDTVTLETAGTTILLEDIIAVSCYFKKSNKVLCLANKTSSGGVDIYTLNTETNQREAETFHIPYTVEDIWVSMDGQYLYTVGRELSGSGTIRRFTVANGNDPYTNAHFTMYGEGGEPIEPSGVAGSAGDLYVYYPCSGIGVFEAYVAIFDLQELNTVSAGTDETITPHKLISRSMDSNIPCYSDTFEAKPSFNAAVPVETFNFSQEDFDVFSTIRKNAAVATDGTTIWVANPVYFNSDNIEDRRHLRNCYEGEPYPTVAGNGMIYAFDMNGNRVLEKDINLLGYNIDKSAVSVICTPASVPTTDGLQYILPSNSSYVPAPGDLVYVDNTTARVYGTSAAVKNFYYTPATNNFYSSVKITVESYDSATRTVTLSSGIGTAAPSLTLFFQDLSLNLHAEDSDLPIGSDDVGYGYAYNITDLSYDNNTLWMLRQRTNEVNVSFQPPRRYSGEPYSPFPGTIYPEPGYVGSPRLVTAADSEVWDTAIAYDTTYKRFDKTKEIPLYYKLKNSATDYKGGEECISSFSKTVGIAVKGSFLYALQHFTDEAITTGTLTWDTYDKLLVDWQRKYTTKGEAKHTADVVRYTLANRDRLDINTPFEDRFDREFAKYDPLGNNPFDQFYQGLDFVPGKETANSSGHPVLVTFSRYASDTSKALRLGLAPASQTGFTDNNSTSYLNIAEFVTNDQAPIYPADSDYTGVLSFNREGRVETLDSEAQNHFWGGSFAISGGFLYQTNVPNSGPYGQSDVFSTPKENYANSALVAKTSGGSITSGIDTLSWQYRYGLKKFNFPSSYTTGAPMVLAKSNWTSLPNQTTTRGHITPLCFPERMYTQGRVLGGSLTAGATVVPRLGTGVEDVSIGMYFLKGGTKHVIQDLAPRLIYTTTVGVLNNALGAGAFSSYSSGSSTSFTVSDASAFPTTTPFFGVAYSEDRTISTLVKVTNINGNVFTILAAVQIANAPSGTFEIPNTLYYLPAGHGVPAIETTEGFNSSDLYIKLTNPTGTGAVPDYGNYTETPLGALKPVYPKIVLSEVDSNANLLIYTDAPLNIAGAAPDCVIGTLQAAEFAPALAEDITQGDRAELWPDINPFLRIRNTIGSSQSTTIGAKNTYDCGMPNVRYKGAAQLLDYYGDPGLYVGGSNIHGYRGYSGLRHIDFSAEGATTEATISKIYTQRAMDGTILERIAFENPIPSEGSDSIVVNNIYNTYTVTLGTDSLYPALDSTTYVANSGPTAVVSKFSYGSIDLKAEGQNYGLPSELLLSTFTNSAHQNATTAILPTRLYTVAFNSSGEASGETPSYTGDGSATPNLQEFSSVFHTKASLNLDEQDKVMYIKKLGDSDDFAEPVVCLDDITQLTQEGWERDFTYAYKITPPNIQLDLALTVGHPYEGSLIYVGEEAYRYFSRVGGRTRVFVTCTSDNAFNGTFYAIASGPTTGTGNGPTPDGQYIYLQDATAGTSTVIETAPTSGTATLSFEANSCLALVSPSSSPVSQKEILNSTTDMQLFHKNVIGLDSSQLPNVGGDEIISFRQANNKLFSAKVLERNITGPYAILDNYSFDFNYATRYKLYRGETADLRVSTNPAMQLLDYLTNPIYGKSLDLDTQIDLDSFKSAAKLCDAQSSVSLVVKRYIGSLIQKRPTAGEKFNIIYNPPFGTAPNKTVFSGTVAKVTSRIYEGSEYYEIEFSKVTGKLGRKWRDFSQHTDNYVYHKGVAVYSAFGGSDNLIEEGDIGSYSATEADGGLPVGTGDVILKCRSTTPEGTYVVNETAVVDVGRNSTSFVSAGGTGYSYLYMSIQQPIESRNLMGAYAQHTDLAYTDFAVRNGVTRSQSDFSFLTPTSLRTVNENSEQLSYVFFSPSFSSYNLQVEKNKKYTASVYVWVTAGSSVPVFTGKLRSAASIADNAYVNGSLISPTGTIPNAQWVRLVFTFDIPSSAYPDSTEWNFSVWTNSYTGAPVIYYAAVQFEEGDTATEFAPTYADFKETVHPAADGSFVYVNPTAGGEGIREISQLSYDQTVGVQQLHYYKHTPDESFSQGIRFFINSSGVNSGKVSNDGNPLVKSWNSNEGAFTASGYSLYDCDSIKAWPMVGWDSQEQTSVTRHQNNTRLDTGNSIFDNVNYMLEQFNGILTYSGGKYALTVETTAYPEEVVRSLKGTLYTPSHITEDNIIGTIDITDKGAKNSFNSISAKVADPITLFDARDITFINSVYLKQDNFVVKEGTWNSASITNYFNARINVRQALDSSRYSLDAQLTLGPEGILLVPGQIVTISYSRFNWNKKEFRINSMSLKKDGNVGLLLKEHSDSFYTLLSSGETTLLPQDYKSLPIPSDQGQ